MVGQALHYDLLLSHVSVTDRHNRTRRDFVTNIVVVSNDLIPKIWKRNGGLSSSLYVLPYNKQKLILCSNGCKRSICGSFTCGFFFFFFFFFFYIYTVNGARSFCAFHLVKLNISTMLPSWYNNTVTYRGSTHWGGGGPGHRVEKCVLSLATRRN